ncbi:MAG TPA: Hsp20/alpha crystallin family protein, partial [Blastocatellia bacterium]
AIQRRRGGLAWRDDWPTLFPLSVREFLSPTPFGSLSLLDPFGPFGSFGSFGPFSPFGPFGPFGMMRRLSDEMDRAFGRMFEDFGLSRRRLFGEPTVWSPPVEVFERDNNLVVRADLPGLSKDDIKVEMTDDGLVIQGQRKSEWEEEREGLYQSERSYGAFCRVIPLPEGVDAEQVKANFENGVLEVTAPIPEGAQRRRSIPIETGGAETAQTAGGASR